MDYKELWRALQRSWKAESAYEASEWTTTNPARGQCAVSSLIVQDYGGGEIVRFAVDGLAKAEKHFANLIDGCLIDSTFSQFEDGVTLKIDPPDMRGYESMRARLLADEGTKQRYERLKAEVEVFFSQNKENYDG